MIGTELARTEPKAAGVRPGKIATRRLRPSFVDFAWVMIAVALIAFLPSLVSTTGRRAPVSALAAVHGALSFLWLVLFLVQSRLAAKGHLKTHKRLGLAACCLVALMVPTGYLSCILMVRRGFDLSGDLHAEHDPAFTAVFPLGDLLLFVMFFVAAIAYRRRPATHKRLMLFATVVLMPAPLAHYMGHVHWLAALPGSAIMLPVSAFLLAAIAVEYFRQGRVYPQTWIIASAMFLSGPIRAGVIGPSLAWHNLLNWLAH